MKFSESIDYVSGTNDFEHRGPPPRTIIQFDVELSTLARYMMQWSRLCRFEFDSTRVRRASTRVVRLLIKGH